MDITELVESHLLSFTLDYQNLYIEFLILVGDERRVKVFANNTDTSPISVDFIGLHIRSNLTTFDNVPCLGEIEFVNKTDSGFCFDGDMGVIEVTANNLSIENAS